MKSHSIPAQGWHIYGKLNLTNELEAPATTEKAKQLLEAYNLYLRSGEQAALNIGAVFVGNARPHHSFSHLPSVGADHQKVLAFAQAFSRGVFDKVKRKAGDGFQGFSMAAQHGRSLIVRAETYQVLSEISLGDAANKPAKRLCLVPGVPSGNIALPSHQTSRSNKLDNWVNHDLSIEVGLDVTYPSLFEKVANAFEEDHAPTQFEFEKRSFSPGVNLPLVRAHSDIWFLHEIRFVWLQLGGGSSSSNQ